MKLLKYTDIESILNEGLAQAVRDYVRTDKITKEEIDILIKADPTSKKENNKYKYITVLCKWYLNLQNKKDIGNLIDTWKFSLEKFELNTRGLDIQKYMTYDDFAKDQLSYENKTTSKEIERISSIKDLNVIYSSTDMILSIPLTHRASVEYGNKITNWCITSNDPLFWDDYMKRKVHFFFVYDSKNNDPDTYTCISVYPTLESIQEYRPNLKYPFTVGNMYDVSYGHKFYEYFEYLQKRIPSTVVLERIIQDHYTVEELGMHETSIKLKSKNIILDWLEYHNNDIDAIDEDDGNTLLHNCIRDGDYDLFKEIMLLSPKKSFSVQNDREDTLVHLSVESENLDILKEVVKNTEKSIILKENIDGETVLTLAIKLGRKDILNYVFTLGIEPILNLNSTVEGTPLHIAVNMNEPKIVQKLISLGCSKSKNEINIDSKKPLDIANENLKYFLNKGNDNEVQDAEKIIKILNN